MDEERVQRLVARILAAYAATGDELRNELWACVDAEVRELCGLGLSREEAFHFAMELIEPEQSLADARTRVESILVRMEEEFDVLSPEEVRAVNNEICRIMAERLRGHFAQKTLPLHLLEFLKKKASEADISDVP